MKTLILIILSVLTFNNTQAFAIGGESGGGGSGSQSTEQDVVEYIGENGINIKRSLESVGFNIRKILEAGSPIWIMSSNTKKLLSVFSDTTFPSGIDIKVQKAPCFYNNEPNKPKDASLNYNNGKGIMCFSSGLLKRYPSDSLGNQINSLVLHEISHAYGFNEKQAVDLQKAVLEILNLKCHVRIFLKDPSAQDLHFMFSVNIRQGSLDSQDQTGALNQPTITVRSYKVGEYRKETSFRYGDSKDELKLFLSLNESYIQLPVLDFDGTSRLATIHWQSTEKPDLKNKGTFLDGYNATGSIIWNNRNLVQEHNPSMVHITGCYIN